MEYRALVIVVEGMNGWYRIGREPFLFVPLHILSRQPRSRKVSNGPRSLEIPSSLSLFKSFHTLPYSLRILSPAILTSNVDHVKFVGRCDSAVLVKEIQSHDKIPREQIPD
jgi:hypothetical protein